MKTVHREEIGLDDDWDAGHVMRAAEKAVEIWWALPHILNKWISGSIEVEGDSGEYPRSIPHSRLRRFVVKNPEHFQSDASEEAVFERTETSLRVAFHPRIRECGRRYPAILLPYSILYSLDAPESRVSLEVSVEEDEGVERAAKWLKSQLAPKLRSWFLSGLREGTGPLRLSLGLVELEAYTRCYTRLKKRHGHRLVSTWPESTDPQKFVFEDIATAAYLLTLWESEEPRFAEEKGNEYWCIDIGCGNGLLCHLLALEGVKCLGLDVRPRKIWSFYGPETILKAEPVDPSGEESGLPRARWLLGNHSDELTPWIPVMAARAQCNYWVLPCCPWDFYGKFGRRREGESQYRSYLAYVLQLGATLGFTVKEDRLKIPSTKRICHMGLWGGEETAAIPRVLEEARQAQSTAPGVEPSFQTRPPVEIIRNCAGLDRAFLGKIVDRIGRELLPTKGDGEWDPGCSLTLAQAVQLVTTEERGELKAQCGGVQTLMRNHAHVFLVAKGTVALRRPKLALVGKTRRLPCWFHAHHPQGCPNTHHSCAFLHS